MNIPTKPLVLQDIQFTGFEVPEKLTSLCGEQVLAVHNLVGPQKIVQALGPKPSNIKWEGVFLGTNARARVRQIDQYRLAGTELRLSWAEFAYFVVIKNFLVNPLQVNEIPYSIDLEVIEDLTGVPVQAATSSIDQAIINSLNQAQNSVNNLANANNANFMPVILTSGGSIPSDSNTALAYLQSPIDIAPPPPTPTETAGGALG